MMGNNLQFTEHLVCLECRQIGGYIEVGAMTFGSYETFYEANSHNWYVTYRCSKCGEESQVFGTIRYSDASNYGCGVTCLRMPSRPLTDAEYALEQAFMGEPGKRDGYSMDLIRAIPDCKPEVKC
jgi:hypothetical protein